MPLIIVPALVLGCTGESGTTSRTIDTLRSPIATHQVDTLRSGFYETLDNPTPETVTRGLLEVLHGWSLAFYAARGRWPDRIEEIYARDSTDSNFLPRERWWHDAWGRRMVYKIGRNSNELRSAGEDGRLGTPDDLIVSWKRF